MSYTEIYAVKDGQQPISIGDTRNAHRGAMYVWNDIAKRYFGLDMFPIFDNDMQMKVWNAGDHADISEVESIVLLSTMDKAMTKKEDAGKLIQAFIEYGNAHENSSLKEQAELISASLSAIPDDYFIAINQTSVGDGWWCNYGDEYEEITADLSKGFNMFEVDTT